MRGKDLKREFTPRLIDCLRAGYTSAQFRSDIFAGITVGVVALPLAMAFAIASGVTPAQGLITAIIAGFLISALGGSPVQIGGPTGAFVVIVYGIVEKHGYEGLATATIMAGVMLILLGLLRAGNLIKFIPFPVTTGFTAGIALIIFSSQIKDFFGLPIEKLPSGFLEKWALYVEHAANINLYSTLLGFGCLLALILLRRFFPRFPGAIFVVTVAAALTSLLALPVETIGSRFGELPAVIPTPSWPVFHWDKARLLFPEALTVALLAGIESLLSAVVADGMIDDRHKSNCELVAQGTANVASIFFGGIPATGAIARTATNVRSGAVTPVSGMVHACFLLLCVLFLSPLASLIPLCSLAAILFVVSYNMAEIEHFRRLLRAPRNDVAVLLVSFFLTVLVDLTVAVEVGVVLSALLFMNRMSEVTDAIGMEPVFQDEMGGGQSEGPHFLQKREVPEDVAVFQLSGPFFFGVAGRVKDVLGTIQQDPSVFILRMRRVPVIDATGLHTLEELHSKCTRNGKTLLLSGVRDNVERKLRQIGLWQRIGEKNILPDIDAALQRADELRLGKK